MSVTLTKKGISPSSSINVTKKISSFLATVEDFNEFDTDTRSFEKVIDGQDVAFY